MTSGEECKDRNRKQEGKEKSKAKSRPDPKIVGTPHGINKGAYNMRASDEMTKSLGVSKVKDASENNIIRVRLNRVSKKEVKDTEMCKVINRSIDFSNMLGPALNEMSSAMESQTLNIEELRGQIKDVHSRIDEVGTSLGNQISKLESSLSSLIIREAKQALTE